MKAFQIIFSHLERGLKLENCTMPRFQILFILYMENSMSAVDISKRLLVTRGNISMFLKRMETDGLVLQSFPKGKKRPVYKLTKKGKKLFEKIFPGHISRVCKIMPVLDKKTLNQFINIKNS